jgi:hypothetical protein
MLRVEDIEALERQYREQEPVRGTSREIAHRPQAKLFNPIGAATWLLSELEPGTSIAFGLCDLGFQCPELGLVDLEEVWDVRLPGGLRIERDIYFTPNKTLSEYASEASRLGYIRA